MSNLSYPHTRLHTMLSLLIKTLVVVEFYPGASNRNSIFSWTKGLDVMKCVPDVIEFEYDTGGKVEDVMFFGKLVVSNL